MHLGVKNIKLRSEVHMHLCWTCMLGQSGDLNDLFISVFFYSTEIIPSHNSLTNPFLMWSRSIKTFIKGDRIKNCFDIVFVE